MKNTQQLEEFRTRLEQADEFDMQTVSDVVGHIGAILGPTHNQMLNTFLTSQEVYKPDATRKKLLAIIDDCLNPEKN